MTEVANATGLSIDTTPSMKVKASGTTLKVWRNGTLQINTTDSSHDAGAVALTGDYAIFSNLKVGYDNNADDDIDDVGDVVIIDESFGGTSFTVTYDKAGNLIDDGRYQYVYDAWNRLVSIRASEDTSRVVQTCEFDGLGRRTKKVVEHSGQLDKTEVYLYDGQKIIEIRDGSNNMVQQFIHGTQYIDELVMVRVAGKGELYIHQDANWNVIATTDMGGHVVERTILTPYGEVSIEQETSWGDYDGDNDVDADDRPVPLPSVCGQNFSGACRIIDLNFDGAYSFADRFAHPYLPQGLARHPGLTATATQQPFAHQGLFFEEEVRQYQNRARQYHPAKRRFLQRDPLTTIALANVGYHDGMCLYGYIVGNPSSQLDPSGLIMWGPAVEKTLPVIPSPVAKIIVGTGIILAAGTYESLNGTYVCNGSLWQWFWDGCWLDW